MATIPSARIDQPIDESLVASTVAELGRVLTDRRSALAVDGRLDADLERQTRLILAEALALAADRSDIPVVTVEYGEPASLTHTAELRATQDVHPGESLMAAEAIFAIALPLIVPDGASADDIVRASRALHHAIWRRFPPGAISYVEFLRAKLSAAHQDSRRQVSLELHDRVAHGVAAGIQRIELSQLRTDATSRDADLARATEILRDALQDVQDLALELRQRVGERSLDAAIAEYVDNARESGPPITLEVVGDSVALAGSVGEEAFTIVLEALRNVRSHAAGATQVGVRVEWAPTRLTVLVADDGPGFDARLVRTRSIGLSGMQERAASIGARLEVATASDGTRVSLALPLSDTVLR